MKKIHLILILTAALWNLLPAGSLFRPLFDLIGEDPGNIIVTADPDVDPLLINTPPPR